jgi:hypothetical protein
MKKQIKKETRHGLLEITIETGESFSITADFFENRPDGNNSPRRLTSFGCLHEEILGACPELKPFVDLHLSDLNGIPMHAVENGFYWLQKAASLPQEYAPEQSAEKCFSYLLSHLRIDEREGNQIMGKVVNAYIDGKAKIATSDPVSPKCKEEQEKQGLFDAKNAFKKEVDSMKERWQNEAAQAIKLLEEIK